VAWDEVYFRSKRRLHPSSHLATIDMGHAWGWVCPSLWGSWVQVEHNVAYAEVYLRTKWHLEPRSRLATIDVGRKLGGAPLLLG